jgi:hypothetical protein
MRKRIKLDNGNDEYIESFIDISKQEGKTHGSIAQYTSRVGQFARWLQRDILTATEKDLNNWLADGNEFKKNHLTAFYKTLLTNNVANFQEKIDRSLLLYLVVH